AARCRGPLDPARGDQAAREPLLGPRRPARQRHRLARGGELRRAGLALAERVATLAASGEGRSARGGGCTGRALTGAQSPARARAPRRAARARTHAAEAPPSHPPDSSLARAAAGREAPRGRTQARAAPACDGALISAGPSASKGSVQQLLDGAPVQSPEGR